MVSILYRDFGTIFIILDYIIELLKKKKSILIKVVWMLFPFRRSWEQNSPAWRETQVKNQNERQTSINETLQQNFFVFLGYYFLFKPQYYSPLYDAHGVGRVNTTSFTFVSSVSSQGPLPKGGPSGGVWGRGGEEGGCTGLGGQRHSHTGRLRGSQRSFDRFVCLFMCDCDRCFYQPK